MAILLLLPLALAGLVACNEHVDFDQVAQDFANRKSAEIGHSVKWWDLYAKQPDMASYQQYKITTWVEQTNYDPVQSNVTAPGYTYTQWYHNGGTEDIISKFTKTVEKDDTYSWSLTNSIKFGESMTISVGIPEIFTTDTTFNMEMDTGETNTQTHSEKQTYAVENDITIPAHTSVKATLVITDETMDVPYDATIHVDGWIAIWFNDQWNGHWLWFFSIDQVAEGDVRATGDNHLVYPEKGMFHGVRGTTYDLKLEQYPYDGQTSQPTKTYHIRPNVAVAGK